MEHQNEPFEVLARIAVLSKQKSQGLPAQIDATPMWSGIGFDLAGMRCVAPMIEVAEMLEMPAFTRIPGVKPWVRGVSNVRGRLLPLLDLEAYFDSQLSQSKKRHRVLTIDIGEFYCGVIVDQVHGMQHFKLDDYSDDVTDKIKEDSDAAVLPYLKGAYKRNREDWLVFSLYELARSPSFFNAAVS